MKALKVLSDFGKWPDMRIMLFSIYNLSTDTVLCNSFFQKMYFFIHIVTALDLKWIFSPFILLKEGTCPINNHPVYYSAET